MPAATSARVLAIASVSVTYQHFEAGVLPRGGSPDTPLTRTGACVIRR
jgi:hypothetical protein